MLSVQECWALSSGGLARRRRLGSAYGFWRIWDTAADSAVPGARGARRRGATGRAHSITFALPATLSSSPLAASLTANLHPSRCGGALPVRKEKVHG